MPYLYSNLDLERCPHCNVDRPNFDHVWTCQSQSAMGNKRFWVVYFCKRCGGAVLAAAPTFPGNSTELYPSSETVDDDAIPSNARTYLNQAIGSQHAPAGAVMLAASAVDAMLKARGIAMEVCTRGSRKPFQTT